MDRRAVALLCAIVAFHVTGSVAKPQDMDQSLRQIERRLEAKGTELERDDAENVTVVRFVEDSVTTADIQDAAKLPHLQVVVFDGASVANVDLLALGDCKKLREITFDGVELSGDVLRQVAQIPTLEAVDISGTDIGDDGIVHLSRLPKLKTLLGADTRISGAGLEGFAGRSALAYLSLDGCPVDERGMKVIGGIATLQRLSLLKTPVADDGVPHIAGLRRLQYLYLNGTAVTDEGVAALAELPELRDIGLADTKVTVRGIMNLRHLPNIQRLGCQDTGVPDWQITAFWIVADATWKRPPFSTAAQKGASAAFDGTGAEFRFAGHAIDKDHVALIEFSWEGITTLTLDGVKLDGKSARAIARAKRRGAEARSLSGTRVVKLLNMSIDAEQLRPFVQLPAVEVLDLSGSKVDENVWSEVPQLSGLKTLIAKDAKLGPVGAKWLREHHAEVSP